MGKGWLVDGKWLGPPRSGGQGDREAQTRRQNEKRKMQRIVARKAAGKPKRWSKGGRKPGSHSKLQCQKTPWMIRRRFRGKQTPMGVTVFARPDSGCACVRPHNNKQTANTTCLRMPIAYAYGFILYGHEFLICLVFSVRTRARTSIYTSISSNIKLVLVLGEFTSD